MAERDEIDRLRDEIEHLRALIHAELELGNDADRDYILTTAALLREKTRRLSELGWID